MLAAVPFSAPDFSVFKNIGWERVTARMEEASIALVLVTSGPG
jgi:hypothetical protein